MSVGMFPTGRTTTLFSPPRSDVPCNNSERDTKATIEAVAPLQPTPSSGTQPEYRHRAKYPAAVIRAHWSRRNDSYPANTEGDGRRNHHADKRSADRLTRQWRFAPTRRTVEICRISRVNQPAKNRTGNRNTPSSADNSQKLKCRR